MERETAKDTVPGTPYLLVPSQKSTDFTHEAAALKLHYGPNMQFLISIELVDVS